MVIRPRTGVASVAAAVSAAAADGDGADGAVTPATLVGEQPAARAIASMTTRVEVTARAKRFLLPTSGRALRDLGRVMADAPHVGVNTLSLAAGGRRVKASPRRRKGRFLEPRLALTPRGVTA